MSLLAKILEQKRTDVERLGVELPSAPPKRPVDLARRPDAPLALIAEIKRRSPSAGALSTRLSVTERASIRGAGARRSACPPTRRSLAARSRLARRASHLPMLRRLRDRRASARRG
jgi:hypothetical protein